MWKKSIFVYKIIQNSKRKMLYDAEKNEWKGLTRKYKENIIIMWILGIYYKLLNEVLFYFIY